MPFKREGLCATDQRKCAKMLARGMHPREVAQRLRTTVKYVLEFTQAKLDAGMKKKKGIEKLALEHRADTQKTADALAGAAKTILTQGPGDPVANSAPQTVKVDVPDTDPETFE